MTDWPQIEPVSADLCCAEPPADAVFLDNNVFKKPSFVERLRVQSSPLMSAVVFVEALAGRYWMPDHRRSVETRLRDNGIRVVPFDAEDAAHFRRLFEGFGRSLRHPAAGEDDENKQLRSARSDLMILASALRHRRLLVTANAEHFRRFGHEGCWTTHREYAATRGWTLEE